jgi:hypothetical protein
MNLTQLLINSGALVVRREKTFFTGCYSTSIAPAPVAYSTSTWDSGTQDRDARAIEKRARREERNRRNAADSAK